MSSLETSSPVSASTLAYLMRWPVFLLIWLKLTFSVSEVAGNSATGHVTSDSFKKPFQFARGAIVWNSTTIDGDSMGQAARGSMPKPNRSAFGTGIADRGQRLAHGLHRLVGRQSRQWFVPGHPDRKRTRLNS